MEILPQLLINSLIVGSLYALASAGLALSYGLLRVLNFAHGHLLMVGAYAYLFALEALQLGIIGSAVFAAGISIILSFGTLKIFIEPFANYGSFLPLVTTLCLATILESLVAISFGVSLRSLPGANSIESYELYRIYITTNQILICLSALLVFGLLGFVVHATPLGRRIRVLAEQPEAGQAIGISSSRISRLVFTFSLIVTSFAGVMIAYETNLQPTMGNSYTIKAFAAMVLGGLGNVWGTLFGSYFLGLVENLSIGLDFGDYSLPAGYKDAFAYLIILGVLLIRPQGLFGFARRRA